MWGKNIFRIGTWWRVGNGQQFFVEKDQKDHKIPDSWGPTGQWNVPLIQDCFDNGDVENIPNIILPRSNQPDRTMWQFTKNGIFIVKSGYHVANSRKARVSPSDISQAEIWWKRLWSANVPSKVMFFDWRLFNNFLPTVENLRNRGVDISGRCSRCGAGKEDSFHVFWRCK